MSVSGMQRRFAFGGQEELAASQLPVPHLLLKVRKILRFQ